MIRIAICFKDVQAGDVVSLDDEKLLEVLKISIGVSHVHLKIKGIGEIRDRPHAIIALLHRPWPEGKTKFDMVNSIVLSAASVSSFGSISTSHVRLPIFIQALREAIEAYELGKPLDEARVKS